MCVCVCPHMQTQGGVAAVESPTEQSRVVCVIHRLVHIVPVKVLELIWRQHILPRAVRLIILPQLRHTHTKKKIIKKMESHRKVIAPKDTVWFIRCFRKLQVTERTGSVRNSPGTLRLRPFTLVYLLACERYVFESTHHCCSVQTQLSKWL